MFSLATTVYTAVRKLCMINCTRNISTPVLTNGCKADGHIVGCKIGVKSSTTGFYLSATMKAPAAKQSAIWESAMVHLSNTGKWLNQKMPESAFCIIIQYSYLKNDINLSNKNRCSLKTAPIFCPFCEFIKREQNTRRLGIENQLARKRYCFARECRKFKSNWTCTEKLLWAVKTLYKALCKAIEKGCSL